MLRVCRPSALLVASNCCVTSLQWIPVPTPHTPTRTVRLFGTTHSVPPLPGNGESYRPIPPFDGHCKQGAQASTTGQIWRPNGTVSAGGLNRSGYRIITLNYKPYRVHRLVAETFLTHAKAILIAEHGEDMAGKLQVDHKDGVRDNNTVSNLQWVTPKHHAIKTASTLPRPRPLIASAMPLKARCLRTGETRVFRSIRHASEELHLPPVHVNEVARRRQRPTCGWAFYFLPQLNWPGERFRSVRFLADSYVGKRLPMVSNQGRVRHSNGRTTEGYLVASGYRSVGLAGREYLVHRLCAEVFLHEEKARWLSEGYDESYLDVDHIDGNPCNNSLNNLRWLPRDKHAQATVQRLRARGKKSWS
ncbi:unnamed protein product [Vitrella brassicaformis CCMP3155]|uniref:HNH nuclease domain-containing protein n=1 Tax=Vitrella brassicaformis (strain CCMP3155) TaxID=1169540 RepID=A0A0G4FIB6_VITBC|nr:unnamed protein product [Vitrella brassicaformis CCMP3155]|eukprot:CEM13225.1 unnamed protein product [Vitrella brassicaformis CCMP3155]